MNQPAAVGTADTLLEYQSPEGPEVTHLRGLVLMNAIENLKSWGVYEAYLGLLSAEHRTLLTSTIATSWVPVEHAVLHYETVQQLDVDEAKVEDAGARLAGRVAEMFLTAPLRAAKQGDGIEVFASVLSKNDKLWERMYRGGGCTALRLGPKDLSLEDHGNPLSRFFVFRRAYVAYMHALASMFQPGAQVHEISAREADSLLTRFSWT